MTKGIYAHLAAAWQRCLGIDCVWHLQDLSLNAFGEFSAGCLACFRALSAGYRGGWHAHRAPASRAIQQRVTVLLNGIDTALFHPGIDGQPVRTSLASVRAGARACTRLTWKGQHYL